ncbi:MAG TPA: N-acetyl-gamma-glutamyl-phosphate reductase [Ktedonobacteraceae bacterium]
MITTSIVNVTSYTGLELLRLLSQHPEFSVTSVTARSSAGKALAEVFPQLQGSSCASLTITEEPEQSELAFVCLPHAAAAASAIQLLQRGTKVVDLSADFRLRDAAQYATWYKHTHPAPALLETAIYGLCERYRSRMEGASLVANPGCYATAAILALIPALANDSIGRDIIIDAKSGASGAGRSPAQGTHYSDMNEDVSAYSVTGHRHLAEITQELEAAAGDAGYPLDDGLRITFIPHLMPMTRGILATCYADLKRDAAHSITTTREAIALYEEFYANEPFIRIVDEPPHTKWSYGSNLCLIHPMVDTRTGRLLVIACLDNLVKGAAGQALQNANRLFGLPETTGLPLMALYP